MRSRPTAKTAVALRRTHTIRTQRSGRRQAAGDAGGGRRRRRARRTTKRTQKRAPRKDAVEAAEEPHKTWVIGHVDQATVGRSFSGGVGQAKRGICVCDCHGITTAINAGAGSRAAGPAAKAKQARWRRRRRCPAGSNGRCGRGAAARVGDLLVGSTAAAACCVHVKRSGHGGGGRVLGGRACRGDRAGLQLKHSASTR